MSNQILQGSPQTKSEQFMDLLASYIDARISKAEASSMNEQEYYIDQEYYIASSKLHQAVEQILSSIPNLNPE